LGPVFVLGTSEAVATIALWPVVPNCTAWWQRHTGVSSSYSTLYAYWWM